MSNVNEREGILQEFGVSSSNTCGNVGRGTDTTLGWLVAQ